MHRQPAARRAVHPSAPRVVRQSRGRARLLVAVGGTVALGAGVLAAVGGSSQAALNPVALYVSPSGTAGAAGTVSAPTTLASAVTRIARGGTVYLRGGTYKLSSTVTVETGNDGTASAVKEIAAYPGETPVLDFSAQSEAASNRGLQLFGDYWAVRGIVVQRAGDNGIYVGGSHNVIDRVVTRFNRDTGLQIGRAASSTPRSDWPAYNLVVSSQSHDNRDAAGENADGFAAKLTVGPGNVFRYDVAHNNVDDGWDLYAKTETGPIDPVTIEDSLAFSNGTLSDGTQAANGDRNGFKLGGSSIAVNHVIRRSFAVGNGQHGFTWNSNPGAISVSDNVSVDNTERNFAFDGGVSVFRRDTSCRTKGTVADKISGDADASNQWWKGSNGTRCSAYTGTLGWSFTSTGALSVTFGGKPATTATATPTPTTSTASPSATSTTKSPTATATSTSTSPTSSTSTTTAAGTLLSDDFEDGDTAGWSFPAGTWGVRSAGSKVLGQAATGTTVALAGPPTWKDVDVRATASNTGDTGSGSAVAVLARAQDGGSHYALVVRDANKVELRRVVGGRATVLARVPFAAAQDRAFAVRLVVKGSTLSGYVDGVLLVSATDTTFAAGRAGVGTVNATATFDAVSVRGA